MATCGGIVAKSCPTLGTSWTVACQAPVSVGFSRQEYWSGLPSFRGSSIPRNQTQVSCIAGGFLHCRWLLSLPTELHEKPYGYLIFTFKFSIKNLLVHIIYST